MRNKVKDARHPTLDAVERPSPDCASMITPRSKVRLGITATHLRFVGGLVPEEDGRLSRDTGGKIKILAGIERLARQSPAPPTVVQISIFTGVRDEDVAEVLSGIRNLGMTPEMILMIGGVDPMSPSEENKFVELAVENLETAKRLGVDTVISTSFEDWMNDQPRKEGKDYQAAVEQVIKGHQRAYEEASLADSNVNSWHLEFLRPIEFNTFTDIGRGWDVVKGLNESLGETYFRVLVDAAHCGDSGLSMAQNQEIIREIGAAKALGTFHASAKTTRGCLSSDDGWISTLLTTCAETGGLDTVVVEVFDHEDDALQPLREAVPGHGVDTRDGRSMDEMMSDGLADITRRLNNLTARGVLPPA